MYIFHVISIILVSAITGISGSPISRNNYSPPSVIATTKVTPAYWRASFSDPPLNIQGNAFFRDFYALVEQITSDPDVKVVVFDSSSDFFFSDHVDFINPLDQDLWPGASIYWDSITRLTRAPVLTIAAIRGLARNAGAEIAAVLDVRFGSKEKAVIGQLEVGFGTYSKASRTTLPQFSFNIFI
jgi:enoyl-CoA hydratase/carnithine racemase